MSNFIDLVESPTFGFVDSIACLFSIVVISTLTCTMSFLSHYLDPFFFFFFGPFSNLFRWILLQGRFLPNKLEGRDLGRGSSKHRRMSTNEGVKKAGMGSEES